MDGGDLLFGPFWIREHPQRDLLREKALLEARCALRMGVGAVNVGRADLADGLPFVEQLGRDPGLPWVSTNLRKKGGGYPFPRWRILKAGQERIAVFGLLRPEPGKDATLGLEVSDPVEAAREALKELSGEKVIVCLSNLGLSEEKRLAAAVPGITYIVGGGSNELASTPETAGETLLLHAGEQGKYLGILEVGRGAAYTHRIVTLDGAGGENAEVAGWVSAFKKFEAEWRLPPGPSGSGPEPTPPASRGKGREEVPPAKESKEAKASKRATQKRGEIPHVGSDACANCHAREHRSWLGTAHARAYAALKGSVQDSRCLSCHSTLLRKAEGASVEPAVGCEACHGPGGVHRGRGDLTRKPAEAACRSCHRGFHEGRKFDLKDAYEKVRCDRKG